MTANTAGIDDKVLMLFEGNLKRIFAMKISRSTFRELQNVLLACTSGNKDLANFLFEILLTGQVKQGTVNEKQQEVLEDIIKHFTIPARLAKDVYERGEFINIITSDLVKQEKESAMLNRLRRVDGEEFVFLSDPQNTVNILQHFIGRVQEFQGSSEGREAIAKFKKELNLAGEKLKQMAI